MNAQNTSSSNFIFSEISQRLLARLALLKIKPINILLQDSSQTLALPSLKMLFPEAKISQCASANQTYELIVDNCSLVAADDLTVSLFNLKKLLSTDGLVIFGTLGLASFVQYRFLLKPGLHLIDMHNLGDLMLNLNFVDPVMEMEIIRLNYNKASTLLNDLQQGQLLADTITPHELNTPINTTLEIIYGHAWRKVGFHNQFTDESNNTYISIDSIEYMD